MKIRLERLTAVVLTTLFTTTAAVAGMSDSALESKLARYGFTVDASTLTKTQRAQAEQALKSGKNNSERKQAINGALRSN